MVKGMKINSETYVKTIKRLKQQINHIHLEKKPMFLQHDNATPHTTAATSVAIASDLKLFHTLPIAQIDTV